MLPRSTATRSAAFPTWFWGKGNKGNKQWQILSEYWLILVVPDVSVIVMLLFFLPGLVFWFDNAATRLECRQTWHRCAPNKLHCGNSQNCNRELIDSFSWRFTTKRIRYSSILLGKQSYDKKRYTTTPMPNYSTCFETCWDHKAGRHAGRWGTKQQQRDWETSWEISQSWKRGYGSQSQRSNTWHTQICPSLYREYLQGIVWS